MRRLTKMFASSVEPDFISSSVALSTLSALMLVVASIGLILLRVVTFLTMLAIKLDMIIYDMVSVCDSVYHTGSIELDMIIFDMVPECGFVCDNFSTMGSEKLDIFIPYLLLWKCFLPVGPNISNYVDDLTNI